MNCTELVMNQFSIPAQSSFTCALFGICLVIIGVAMPSISLAQGFVEEKESLKGLEGVYVMGGDLDDEIMLTGLQKNDVLSVVSTGLISSGVPVLDESEWLMIEDSPVLHIDISSSVDHEAYTLYTVRFEVLFLMNKLSDARFTTYAVVWGDGMVGVLDGSASELILEDIQVLVDRLAADFHAVNS